MNWRLAISAILALILIPVSAFGQMCDLRCSLGVPAAHHDHVSAATSSSNEMSPASCHSMHHASPSSTSCQFAAHACAHGDCASNSNWLAGLKSSSDQALLSTRLPFAATISAPPALTSALTFSAPIPIHRPLSVLRI